MTVALNYVGNFVESLNLSDECQELAGVLLKSVEDCKAFYIGFLGRNNHTIDDFLDYREERISMADVSLDNFLIMCDNCGIRKTFENVFLQPFTLEDIALISNCLQKGKTTLIDIFNQFKANVNQNIMRIVL